MATIKKGTERESLPTLRSSLGELFDVNRILNDFNMESPFWERSRLARIPAANIRETESEFTIELAVPGMKKKDFQVDVDNNLLEIKVEREREETTEEKEKWTRREYDYTAFYRSFNLPESVDADKIKATYEDGVLRLNLPKTEKSRKRPVKEISVG